MSEGEGSSQSRDSVRCPRFPTADRAKAVSLQRKDDSHCVATTSGRGPDSHQSPKTAISHQLRAMSHELSAISHEPWAMSYQLLRGKHHPRPSPLPSKGEEIADVRSPVLQYPAPWRSGATGLSRAGRVCASCWPGGFRRCAG